MFFLALNVAAHIHTYFIKETYVHMYVCIFDSASSTQQDACHFIIAAKEVGRVGALLKKTKKNAIVE